MLGATGGLASLGPWLGVEAPLHKCRRWVRPASVCVAMHV